MSATLHRNSPNSTLSSENSRTMQRTNRRENENKNLVCMRLRTRPHRHHRTASLPGFTAPSTSTLPSTFMSNSSRKLHPMKLISKKIPLSRAYPSSNPCRYLHT
ncbi:hypothetical protein BDR07DRAFT_1419551 [Suillus spraguei]|nr:hypothetical protein BDR07DRAFT_1419551 [Suillus spraguei]